MRRIFRRIVQGLSLLGLLLIGYLQFISLPEDAGGKKLIVRDIVEYSQDDLPPKFPVVVLADSSQILFYTQMKMSFASFFSYPVTRRMLWFRDRDLYTMLKEINRQQPIPPGKYVFDTSDSVDEPQRQPVLAFASTKKLVAENKVVLIPDNEALRGYDKLLDHVDVGIGKYPWSQKEAKIFWRGSTTGGWLKSNNWLSIPRVQFVGLAMHLPFVDAGFTSYVQIKDKNDETEFAKQYRKVAAVSPAESLRYKYLIDIDGNSCSYSRMAWILYSNSLLFKHRSDNVQWYYNELVESVHYLGIATDFSNLETQFKWAESNPEAVVQMIGNAHLLAQNTFRREGIQRALRQALERYQGLARPAIN